MPVDNSRLEGFYKLSVSERRMKLAEIANLSDEHVQAWAANGELSEDAADRMIENVVGTYSLPIGVATNFVIDGEHYLIPFVLEEPSVVAAASNMAKRCVANGGFRSNNDELAVLEVQSTTGSPLVSTFSSKYLIASLSPPIRSTKPNFLAFLPVNTPPCDTSSKLTSDRFLFSATISLNHKNVSSITC